MQNMTRGNKLDCSDKWCCGVMLRRCGVVVLWCCGAQVVAASSLHALVFLFPPTDQNHPIRLIKTLLLMNEGIPLVVKWTVTHPGWVPAACLVARMGSSQNENGNMEHDMHVNYNSKFRHLFRKSCLLRDTLLLFHPYASFIPLCKKISLPV